MQKVKNLILLTTQMKKIILKYFRFRHPTSASRTEFNLLILINCRIYLFHRTENITFVSLHLPSIRV